MERALAHFLGAVFVVSHDRLFIEKIANRRLVSEGGCYVREVYGNWITWQARGMEPLGVQEIYCPIKIDCLA